MRLIIILTIMICMSPTIFANEWNNAYLNCKTKFARYKAAGMDITQWGCWESMCAYEACMAEKTYKGASAANECQPHIQVYNQCMQNKNYSSLSTAGVKDEIAFKSGTPPITILKDFFNKLSKSISGVNSGSGQKANNKWRDDWSKKIKGDAKGTIHLISKLPIFRSSDSKQISIQVSAEPFEGSVPIELEDGIFYISSKDAYYLKLVAEKGLEDAILDNPEEMNNEKDSEKSNTEELVSPSVNELSK